MKKNILVITGSPRKGGNSELLADAFIEGAISAGHTVNKWRAAEKKVGGCRACETCFTTGKACSFNDDFNELAPLILKADVLVFATPVYWFTYPAQIKAVMDKFYSFCIGQKPLNDKEAILLSCAQMDDISIFEGVKATYDYMVKFLHLIDRGCVVEPDVKNPGDIIETTALHKARALGNKL